MPLARKEEDFRVPRKWRDESVPKRMPWIEKEEHPFSKQKGSAYMADRAAQMSSYAGIRLHAAFVAGCLNTLGAHLYRSSHV